MRRQDLQAFENIGYIAERIPGIGILRMIATGAPTNGAVGFAPGCLWQSTATYAALTTWYVNEGTAASATWVPFSLAAALAADRIVNVTAASLVVTAAAHGDRVVTLNRATGVAVTLPAFTGSGYKYTFVIMTATSGGSQVFTATGAFLFGGVVQNTDTGASGLFGVNVATNAGGSTTITLDGATQGGRKGDWITIQDIGASQGLVQGMLNASGTEATPFS